MRFFRNIFIILTVFVLSSHANADKNRKIVAHKPQEVNINFKDLSINDFVKLVSNILHKNILLQEGVPGKVDFVSTTPVYKKDLLMILQSVLGSKSYSLVDRGSFLEVVKSRYASQYNLPIVRNVGDSYIQMVTKLIALKGVSVDFVLPKIRHLASASAALVSLRDANTILITDFPKNIKTIQKVINNIEQNQQTKSVFLKLKRAKVDYVYHTMLSIIKNRINSQVGTEKVTISADYIGNSIIVTGNARNIKVVESLIKQLDAVESNSLKQTAVIALKNTEAKDVMQVIIALLRSQSKLTLTAIPTVVSEPNTNSIIISGTQDDIKDIRSIINDLDKEQMQVYVKARIIEVSQEKVSKIGPEYGLVGGQANSSGLYSLAMNMGGPAIAFTPSTLGIDIPKLKSGLALGASIDFLTTHGAARVVSEPSILCLNNKESKIYVGQRQSIATSTKTKDNKADYSTNTYTREDIGLTLKIKPRISNDGKVTLEADTIIEDVISANNQQVGMPTTTKREVSTKAIVKNGESVIVGGLIRDKASKSTSKIPLLGDIPLLGELFTHHTDIGDDVNIVIVLTPYIIKTSDDLTSLRMRLVELDELQNTFSKYFEERLKKRRLKTQKKKSPEEIFNDMRKRNKP